jgi:hypothetical protein
MASALWGVALAVAVLWPARIIGPLDGAPLDTVVEVVLFGLLLPAIWWFHPSFVRRRGARVLVAVLLAWKAVAWFAAPQGGWCVDFVMNNPRETGGWRLTRSWDARVIAEPAPATCTAIMTHAYVRPTHFPAWMINVPYGRDQWLDRGVPILEPLDNPRPPNGEFKLFVHGAVNVDEPGTLSIVTDRETSATGTIDGRPLASRAAESSDASAADTVAATAALEAGSHELHLQLDLSDRNWRFVPMWNDRDVFTGAVATVAPVSSAGRAAVRLARWIAPVIALALLAAWTLTALHIAGPAPATYAAVAALAAALAWAGAAGPDSTLPRLSVAALALALLIPVPPKLRNARGAWLIVGAPWLALVGALAVRSVARYTLFLQGDDALTYQQFAYRIYMQGFWLEGGQPTFWNQPLYRWMCGALHIVFGDSSVGDAILDGFGLLAGSMFAFVVVDRLAGFRSGVAAAVAVLWTFAFGPNWYVIGRGLSEISALMWIYLASCCVIAAGAGSAGLAVLGGIFGVLGYYTRMNHLPLVLALGALTLIDGIEAGAAFDWRRVWKRVPKPVIAAYYATVAAGLCAFAARTWYYTGRFSLFAGTSLGFNAIGLGASVDSWWSADAWSRALSSVLMLVTVQDPPRFDVRSVLVVGGVALSLLALVRVPVVRRLPLGLALICVAAISGGLVVRGSAYPGRFSIHLIPVAVTVSMLAMSVSVRDAVQWRRTS